MKEQTVETSTYDIGKENLTLGDLKGGAMHPIIQFSRELIHCNESQFLVFYTPGNGLPPIVIGTFLFKPLEFKESNLCFYNATASNEFQMMLDKY